MFVGERVGRRVSDATRNHHHTGGQYTCGEFLFATMLVMSTFRGEMVLKSSVVAGNHIDLVQSAKTPPERQGRCIWSIHLNQFNACVWLGMLILGCVVSHLFR